MGPGVAWSREAACQRHLWNLVQPTVLRLTDLLFVVLRHLGLSLVPWHREVDVTLQFQAFKFHVPSRPPVGIHQHPTLSLPVLCRQPVPVLVPTAMHLRTLPTNLKVDQCLLVLTVPANSNLRRDQIWIAAGRSPWASWAMHRLQSFQHLFRLSPGNPLEVTSRAVQANRFSSAQKWVHEYSDVLEMASQFSLRLCANVTLYSVYYFHTSIMFSTSIWLWSYLGQSKFHQLPVCFKVKIQGTWRNQELWSDFSVKMYIAIEYIPVVHPPSWSTVSKTVNAEAGN